MKQKKKIQFGLLFIFIILLSGCAQTETTTEESGQDTAQSGYEILLPGTYDSEDTAAVVVKKDDTASTITFLNIATGKKYTLEYDGTTKIYDKYDTSMAMSQVAEGSILDVTFLKNSKKLNSLQISKDAWTNKSVSKFEIDETKKGITIGKDTYKYSSDLLVFSAAKQMELMDINAADVLTVNGIGTSVYSMSIEKGHGYLRLTGDESFIGGFIEVGQSVIQRVTEGMLLVVPEGSYQVQISNKGVSGTKNVAINRNEEVTLNISDLWGENKQTSTVVFSVTPKDAKVFIDGTQIDTSGPVILDYGIHQLMAKADGYDTITQYLNIAQESGGITVTLDKSEEEEEDRVSENSSDTNSSDTNSSNNNSSNTDSSGSNSSNTNSTVSENTASGNNSSTTTGYYKVYVDAPEGVETYLDGNYMGVTPVNFKKASGSHVITLRKTGYVTRSYTINVDSDAKDVTYSFVELEKE